ncbi:MarR family winged helix-turn-helix transcriptional regulator [Anatilimnocola floriformis]|uniref:MarR family winged helix-turn-helix transcriptional regulator n=1 Tax=Anatilimnocola floriformis TaxID=2948575 RepID=UPI0020C59E74|nr:MarR family transcriptional regulator [Anatilimnocola floriformis]
MQSNKIVRIHTFSVSPLTNWKFLMTAKDQLPLELRAAYLALHRCSDAQFAKLGVTADQFVLMAALSRGDALTQRDLAARMSSDPSTVRAMLVLLEKRGLVTRIAHPTDSRARTVALTEEGQHKFQQLWKAGQAIRDQMVDSLSAAETKLLVKLLERVSKSLADITMQSTAVSIGNEN